MPYINCPVCGKREPPQRFEERCINFLFSFLSYLNKEGELSEDELYTAVFDYLKSDNYNKLTKED